MKALRKPLSLFMAMLMCLGIFAGTGTTAFAAGETMTTYMVEFPRASDPNKAGWGHSAMNFLGGWSTGENNGFTIHTQDSFNGKVIYCIETGVGVHSGDQFTGRGEDFWDDYPSDLNPTIPPDTIKEYIGRIMTYGWQGNASTAWDSRDPADAEDSDTITTHFEYHCMEDNLLKLDMLGHDDPTMIRMLEDLTGVNARTIPLDDPDTMSIFTSSKVLGFENDDLLGPTGAVAIPEFNTRFTRQMLIDTQPKDFNTLVRLSGFSHGTDVWLGNARELIVSGTASVLETVGCRDDIMLYLISMGLDPKMSFKIMEAVRKGKVKKGGFQDGWVEAMQEHDVPEWYIESLAKIGYLFPKAHAVAYVMMAFRIAWFKVHEPLAFYATFFTVRAKAFDAEYCCAGLDAVKRKIREIENNKDASAVEQDLMTTLEVCYEFYRRGFHFDTIDIYRSDATKFTVTEGGLLPPFISVHGLGEAAALDTVEKRRGKEFISVEEFSMCCNKLSKTHIEQLRALGAFAGMADTSQLTLFG